MKILLFLGNTLQKILKRNYSTKNFLIYFFSFAISIFLLLIAGTQIQFFLSTYGLSIEGCGFLDIPLILNQLITPWIIVSLVFISAILSIAIQVKIERKKIFVTSFSTALIVLTISDLLMSIVWSYISVESVLVSLLCNTSGSIFLSLYLCSLMALIQHLKKNYQLFPIILFFIPIISSLILVFLAQSTLRLVYSTVPFHIDGTISENFSGDITPIDDKNRFGYLVSPKSSDDEITNMLMLDSPKITFNSNKNLYDLKIYIGDCYFYNENLNSRIKEIDKNSNFFEMKDIQSFSLSSDYIFNVHVRGKSLYSQIETSPLFIKVQDNTVHESFYEPSNITFESSYRPLDIYINVLPISNTNNKNQDLDKFNIDIITNSQRMNMHFNRKDVNIKELEKKLNCTWHPTNKDTFQNINNKFFPAIVLKFIPKGTVYLREPSLLKINYNSGEYHKAYKNTQKIFDDFSNGYIKKLNITGIENLRINSQIIDIKKDDLVLLESSKIDNLFVFKNNDNKIKFVGAVDSAAINLKPINYSKITELNSKIVLPSIVTWVLGLIFSGGTLIGLFAAIQKFMNKKEKIDLLK